jgi:isopentenyl-diphosphate delta-isomerase
MLEDKEIKVLLVDPTDHPLGTQDKIKAHEQGQLHRAFSVILYNEKGETLIQQRARSKYHSPCLWANSCCGHPFPEENIQEAAHRRLREELGVTADLKFRTHILYFLKLDLGMIEREYVHVFEGRIPGKTEINFNSHEVEGVKWISPRFLQEEVKRSPDQYTRWFRLYLLKYFAKVFAQN